MYTTTLTDLATNESGSVVNLLATGSMRRRLLDLGFTKNTVVTCVGRSPAGDPIAFHVHGCIIALRKRDCKDVVINRGGDSNGTN